MRPCGQSPTFLRSCLPTGDVAAAPVRRRGISRHAAGFGVSTRARCSPSPSGIRSRTESKVISSRPGPPIASASRSASHPRPTSGARPDQSPAPRGFEALPVRRSRGQTRSNTPASFDPCRPVVEARRRQGSRRDVLWSHDDASVRKGAISPPVRAAVVGSRIEGLEKCASTGPD